VAGYRFSLQYSSQPIILVILRFVVLRFVILSEAKDLLFAGSDELPANRDRLNSEGCHVQFRLGGFFWLGFFVKSGIP